MGTSLSNHRPRATSEDLSSSTAAIATTSTSNPESTAAHGDSPALRVLIVAENDPLQSAAANILDADSRIQTFRTLPTELFDSGQLKKIGPDICILASQGDLYADISLIRKIRDAAHGLRTVLFGGPPDEAQFLQYVRAGVKGYLLADSSPHDILAAVTDVAGGKAWCPPSLCAALFRYVELEATTVPSAAMRQRLGLTRREQQIVPLLARGFTNKEIANHFCLSEQTVKNHLYRMKHKVGAGNRLGIVHTCHTQGFLL
jgi:DNA-binding NarL/FixJ family response regulator